MKYLPLLVLISLLGCEPVSTDRLDLNEENWSRRKATLSQSDTLDYGKSYLSVYSQMYSFTQNQKYNMTAMISMRNVSEVDTIYLLRADYFNTEGAKIRTYFDYPIYLLPMETIEIVIDQSDIEGGTGSNFLFEWKTPVDAPEPLFEGVMNSMQGNQGVSFLTRGRRVR
jgi:hypothetical protein